MSPASTALTTSWRIEIGLAVVPAKSTVSLGNPSALEIVLIASGSPLWLGTSGGAAGYLNEKYLSTPLTLPAAAPAGRPVHLSGAGSAAIRNAGDEPDMVWLITIALLARQTPEHAVAP